MGSKGAQALTCLCGGCNSCGAKLSKLNIGVTQFTSTQEAESKVLENGPRVFQVSLANVLRGHFDEFSQRFHQIEHEGEAHATQVL